MAWPQFFMGSALLGAAVLAAVGAGDPHSDLAPPGMRLASASFEGPVRAEVTHVVDGDTFEARAAIWLGQSIEVRVRIAGVDAPELHARCDEELARAQAARDWLIKRIEGGEVRLSSVHYDKYGGRVDAVVRDSGGDVGVALIAAGLARPYSGGHRGGWCQSA
ncbi:MAG TPA: thermonuclease family protein [Rhizomicrobium sp.]|jgi:endonuclease YncB( thermonuclease family)